MITDNILRIARLMLAPTVAVAAIGVSFAQTIDVPSHWKTDCVGRMQLNLPGDVDVAALSAKELEGRFQETILDPYPPNTFTDGQTAGRSEFWFGGRIFVTHPLSEAQWHEIEAAARSNQARSRAFVSKTQSANGKPRTVVDLDIDEKNGLGFSSDNFVRILLHVGPVAFYWAADFVTPMDKDQDPTYRAIPPNLEPREIFQAPNDAGLCFPYAFLKHDIQAKRDVAVTYRSKVHPDITVFLKDMDASKAGPHQDPNKFTATYETQYFWSYYCSTCKSKSVNPLDIHRHTTLAGQGAIESVADLVRKDGTEDFGYLVVAKGDADAKEDTPDLTLYVMRDAANARARGIEPMQKDEFLKMARDIAASVKRRPVHP